MALTPEQYQRISDFIDVNMTIEEMNLFEKELVENIEMQQQLAFEQSVREGLIFKKNTVLAHKTVTHSKKINWIPVTIAASILIAAITYFIIQKKNKKTPTLVKTIPMQKVSIDTANNLVKSIQPDSTKNNLRIIYQQYYSKDSLPEKLPMILADALRGYDEADYSDIKKLNLQDISETRGVLNADKQVIMELGYYYKGIAFLETNGAPKAINNFEWAEKNAASHELKLKASWYLTLAFIKNEEPYKAIKQLKKLLEDDVDRIYFIKAERLLKILKNN